MKFTMFQKIATGLALGVLTIFWWGSSINARVENLEEKLSSECSPWDPRCDGDRDSLSR